jgi:hypothetical protein
VGDRKGGACRLLKRGRLQLSPMAYLDQRMSGFDTIEYDAMKSQMRQAGSDATRSMLEHGGELVRIVVAILNDCMLTLWRRDFLERAAEQLGCAIGEVPVRMHHRLHGYYLYSPERVLLAEAADDALRCACCGARCKDLKPCSACHSAWYCNRECQVADWGKGKHGHKPFCRQYRARGV